MSSLVIGNASDEHAAAVVASIGDRAPVVLIDAASLADTNWHWHNGVQARQPGGMSHTPARGWLRRLAPPGWHEDLVVGSLPYVEAQARLQMLTAVVDRVSGVEWLTAYWDIVRAENKLIQYRVASDAGISVPETVVAFDPADLAALGSSFVLKPLAVGGFSDGDDRYAIHAEVVEATDHRLDGLAAAPFIAQRTVTAVCHLRVPTVRDRAWVCCLPAAGLPVDWRADRDAHSSWTRSLDYDFVRSLALRAADSLKLGYSCQDWIVDERGTAWLVDVNPAGQWLFLPDPVASEVTGAIADWLVA